MRLLFGRSELSVAELLPLNQRNSDDRTSSRRTYQHVQVIEASRPRVSGYPRRRTCDPDNTGPVIPIIDAHSPRVADAGTPRPHIVPAPVADIIINLPPTIPQLIPHQCHPRLRASNRRRTRLHPTPITRSITIIILPVIDAQARQPLRILSFVAFGAGISGAGLGASVTVETELQAHAVDLVGDRFNAVWPFDRVGDEEAGGVAQFCAPAVVDVDVGVAEIFEAKGDEFLGGGEGEGGGGGVALASVLKLFNMILVLRFGQSKCDLLPNYSIPGGALYQGHCQRA